MSTTRQIAHNTIIQIIGKIISVVLGLLAVAMMTRYLGPEKFGWYITAITFLQFVGILIDFGLIPVTSQMLSEPDFDKEKLFKNLLSFRLVTAVLFLGIAPAIALFFPYPTPVKIAIAFSTLSFLGVAMNQVLVGYFQTKLKMIVQVIGENVGRLVLVIGLWLFIYLKMSFLPIMGVVIVSSLAYTIVLWLTAGRETPAGLSFDKQIWLAIIKKSWPIAISIVFNVIYLKGDTILLSLFRPQTEVGFYGAAYRVVDIFSQMGMMMMGVMLPLMAYSWSRNLKDEFRLRLQQSFDTLMFFAVPLTIGTIILAEKTIQLIGGNEFSASSYSLQILAIAVFGVFLGAIFGHTAVAINRQKQTMWIYISDAILTLAGYLIFIPKYGMTGAAWMTVFSELYAGILLFFVVKHYTREKLSFKTFGKILLSGVLMGFALLYLINLNIVLLVLIGMLIYGLTIFLTGGISKKTLQEVFAKAV